MNLKPNQVALAHDLLPKLAIFQGISVPQLGALTEKLDYRAVKAGKVALMDQEISKTLFVLVKGSVGIWQRKKPEHKLIATLQAPNFFGEVSMWTDSAATALVKAAEDSEFLTLSRENFDLLAANDPTFLAMVQSNNQKVSASRPAIQKKTAE